jgi:hypothetical protein
MSRCMVGILAVGRRRGEDAARRTLASAGRRLEIAPNCDELSLGNWVTEAVVSIHEARFSGRSAGPRFNHAQFHCVIRSLMFVRIT